MVGIRLLTFKEALDTDIPQETGCCAMPEQFLATYPSGHQHLEDRAVERRLVLVTLHLVYRHLLLETALLQERGGRGIRCLDVSGAEQAGLPLVGEQVEAGVQGLWAGRPRPYATGPLVWGRGNRAPRRGANRLSERYRDMVCLRA